MQCIVILVRKRFRGFQKSIPESWERSEVMLVMKASNPRTFFQYLYITVTSGSLNKFPTCWIGKHCLCLGASYYELSCRYFSREPHFAGSKRNNDLAGNIAAKWRSYGFDHVKMAKYDVLMNFPHKDLKRTRVEIRRKNKVVFTSHPYEKASSHLWYKLPGGPLKTTMAS